jgi:hypothetical protein
LGTFPEQALASVNAALAAGTDALFSPLLELPAAVSLLLLAAPTAAAIVIVMSRMTDQPQVRHTKRRITAALLEIRLFNDDPRAVLRSVREALRYNVTYLRLTILPLLVLSVPILLLVTHLNAFFGYTGLVPGSTALLKLQPRTTGSALADAEVALELPDAIEVEAGPVRLAGEHEILWRITPAVRGDFIVRVRVGHQAIEKTLHVSEAPSRRSPMRVLPGVLQQLSYPSEPPLDLNGPVSAVSISYTDAAVDVLGMRVHWMILFGVLTLGWAMVLARVLGVTL